MAGTNHPCQDIYAVVSNIFSIKIPKSVVGSFASTWVAAPISFSCCGTRCVPCRRRGCVAYRPLPLAQRPSSPPAAVASGFDIFIFED